MPDDPAITALVEGRHGDPFSLLGPHAVEDGRIRLSAFLPGAAEVEAVDAASGRRIVRLRALHPAGFFAATSRRRRAFAYRLRVRWQSGETICIGDPYAFGPQLDASALRAFHEGRHGAPYRLLGAHPASVDGEAGVRFAVWAPNASRVSVVGEFNHWDGRRHPMRLRHDVGIWELFLPGVEPGALYKFELLDRAGRLLPLKADPYAFAAELRPNSASRVAALLPARRLGDDRAAANRRDAPISIYEVHAASWRQPGGRFPTWDELAAGLPEYAAGMGFTHVELMPVSEHPFDGSWGYQTLGQFAPSARFGDPGGLGRFVDACHRQGLGVLLDWVPAHFPSDAFGLARFDGSALYEYEDPREGFHRDWNTLIYNCSRSEVREFLAGSARYWIEHHGVDGLRVDAVASMLYRDYSRPEGEWLPNHLGGRENLEAISLLQRLNTEIGRDLPGAITVAEESTAFPGVSAPVDAGGLGFHYKWNMGWMNDTLHYIAEDPVHRRWHHDKLTFGLVYAFSENFILPISHDEVVHGKGSMLGKMPGDDWQRFANLRAYYGFMWGHPGKKLLFMGQEFAQPGEWRHDAELPWHLTGDPRHAGMQRLVRDLNHLYRDCPALHRLDCEAAGFEWIEASDAEQSVLAWARRDDAGNLVLVVCNFTPVPRSGYRLGLPDDAGSAWREALNTDAAAYGGSDRVMGQRILHAEPSRAQGRGRSLQIDLPPLGCVFLRSQ
ncbi:1,4-alpha-glucan branching protein GlgB [Pseudomarimonas salicorniae]|uniref:1,4-alpha-glucan branching enzyme GlgB n=1 Tax=Pseudomarimonas salicorniae TaxID=2933270 RepID=A0ABT0GGR9_9GAMM|nr:1,4-alpha-glucan branching protein GlgB [Lysobacter sp. CAU 1642]MCK7593220.1 1,4-alpha-glucan branching protein GlgB [Lysobacter sp. CAU 1642]